MYVYKSYAKQVYCTPKTCTACWMMHASSLPRMLCNIQREEECSLESQLVSRCNFSSQEEIL